MNIDEFLDSVSNISQELDTKKNCIHLHIKQRNGRKSITFVENIELINKSNQPNFMDKIKQVFSKKFNCSVCIKEDNILQLQGDQRNNIKDYLIDNKFIKEDYIVVHGS